MTQWRPLILDCAGSDLMAVLHEPGCPARTGVVVVVGGPQYRVGSHRQFVLLARQLSLAGFPCLRFDYRGMGDSEGAFAGFEQIGLDIRTAIGALIANAPTVTHIVLWGLCDAASAALLYAASDSRICGLIIANPWVRSPHSEARARIRHYYLRRLLSADFWKKVLRGRWRLRDSAMDLRATLATRVETDAPPFVQGMLQGAQAFTGRVLLITSGEDLTAAEFLDRVKASAEWQAVFARAGNARHHIDDATHTFSSAQWRAAVERASVAWVRACNDAS
jgi:exosortase A-associated hydrolase 1